MAEVLSQAEIDALLAALASGDVTADEAKQEELASKIRMYDFKRPNKFSKDQIHTLQVIYENYCRSLTTYFSANLRTLVQISVMSVDQLTYEEFIRSIPNPTIINIFTMAPLDGNGIMEINPNIAFSIIERLFGGLGQAPEKIRALTEIEQSVFQRTTRRMLDNFTEAWENIARVKARLELIETNPQFIQIVAPTEMVVLITISCKIGGVEGLMNICLPYILLEPIINKLSAHFWFSNTGKERTPEQLEVLRNRLERAAIPLSVLLGRTTLTIGELLDLQKGDVIQLDNRADQELEILIGQRPKYRGRPGTFGAKMGIQIVSTLSEGVELDDE
ncbi:flagellar motor switch protein FliM [Heliophilum fasciatum]|uniref:Flagellar motor switch protein FliM n=1 Tax=Heliophilum fasciatum TaxID=35700 RepID=A0A4R2RQ32_9FIRM|nr:flagellar motor switch protein FliM [Heliophilum fasciatum]MCW2277933.1 flagellar motor switch protein FliM [Heliophilum fasciatum]TCP64497.1 flagellar motor switch protein FliM [Heliophilum fasciatum]